MTDLHEELKKFSIDDFVRIPIGEYVETIRALGNKIEKHIKENDIKIDVVVPIMRGAMVAGQYLAYRFGILKVVPVQYKYFFEPDEITLREIMPFNPSGISKNATILVVEQDHCFGTIGSQAVLGIKAALPDARILYAADYMDYSNQKNEGTDEIFFGKLDNNTKTLTVEQCRELGIFEKTYMFPWERIDEESDVISAKQFKYSGLDEVVKNSKKKRTF